MQCERPLRAYQCASGAVVFQELRRHDVIKQIALPCGQCTGCRLERSRQWATRCMHEAQLYEHNEYATFTYDDAHLPQNGNLQYPDFQRFLNRLRNYLWGKQWGKLRYYMCGEYGTKRQRPHYHAALFNCHITDRAYHKTSRGNKLYTSNTLTNLWGNGNVILGELTFESAAYIARYIMEKITGEIAPLHYEQINNETGEITYREPEFNHMSLKPGIGAEWLNQYYTDVYPHGKVVVRGVETRPPKYYDHLAKERDALEYEKLAWQREKEARLRAHDNTDERLAVKGTVLRARIRQLKREIP